MTQAIARARARQTSTTVPSPTWTYRTLAEHWRVNVWTVRRWARQGRLKVVRLGGPEGTTVRITDEERLRFEREAADA